MTTWHSASARPSHDKGRAWNITLLYAAAAVCRDHQLPCGAEAPAGRSVVANGTAILDRFTPSRHLGREEVHVSRAYIGIIHGLHGELGFTQREGGHSESAGQSAAQFRAQVARRYHGESSNARSSSIRATQGAASDAAPPEAFLGTVERLECSSKLKVAVIEPVEVEPHRCPRSRRQLEGRTVLQSSSIRTLRGRGSSASMKKPCERA